MFRHRSYHSFGFDLAVYDQPIWNTTHGRILESTMTGANPVPHSQLSDHFSPVYLLLVPFYFAYPHPETLLVLQTLAVALGAWPVYLLARLKLPAPFALMWVLIYFLFIPLAWVNLYDFHEVAFAVAPLGFALYFLERRRPWLFVLFLVFTFFVKEEMTLIGAGFGLYALLGKRDWKLGLGVVTGSLVAFAVLVQIVIPYFAGGQSYPYFTLRYADVGGSPLGILRTALTNPLRIVRALIVAKKLYFLIAIFGPVLGLTAVAGWATILVLPTLSYLLLSNYEPEFSFSTQYAAPLIPLVIGTSIIAMQRIPERFRVYLAVGVMVSSLGFSWAYGDLPYSRKFDPSLFQTQPRYAAFLPSLDQIPADARVSAENGFPSHFAERRFIYDYGFQGVQDAGWVVLDYEGTNYDLAAFQAQVTHVESLGYQEVASGYGLALLRKS